MTVRLSFEKFPLMSPSPSNWLFIFFVISLENRWYCSLAEGENVYTLCTSWCHRLIIEYGFASDFRSYCSSLLHHSSTSSSKRSLEQGEHNRKRSTNPSLHSVSPGYRRWIKGMGCRNPPMHKHTFSNSCLPSCF